MFGLKGPDAKVDLTHFERAKGTLIQGASDAIDCGMTGAKNCVVPATAICAQATGKAAAEVLGKTGAPLEVIQTGVEGYVTTTVRNNRDSIDRCIDASGDTSKGVAHTIISYSVDAVASVWGYTVSWVYPGNSADTAI